MVQLKCGNHTSQEARKSCFSTRGEKRCLVISGFIRRTFLRIQNLENRIKIDERYHFV